MPHDSVTQVLARLLIEVGFSAPMAVLLAMYALLGAAVATGGLLIALGSLWQRVAGRRPAL